MKSVAWYKFIAVLHLYIPRKRFGLDVRSLNFWQYCLPQHNYPIYESDRKITWCYELGARFAK